MAKKKAAPKILVGKGGTSWLEVKKPMLHWDSSIPHGYFIVEESEDDPTDTTFSVYKGSFDDWYLLNGTKKPLKTFKKLQDALDSIP